MFASLTARTRPTLRRGLIAAAAASMVAGSVIVANVSEAAVVGTPTQIVGEQSNKCLSVEGNNTGNGGRSVIYDCDGGPSQSWTLTNAGELRVYSGGNVKCLDADGWGTAPGTRLVTWDCHGGANQKFTVNGDGSVRNQHNGLCLDVDAWGTGNNNPVILWSCHLGANQRWTQKTGNPGGGTTPVEINGQLKVCGTQLCNQYNRPIQLRGMSSHGIQWYAQCVNDASVDALAKDWTADVMRVSMYIQEGGYETDPAGFTARMNTFIDMVSARGMYVIVDWHQLTPGDPNHNLERAKTFFNTIAATHRDKKNIIYEIANEPNNVAWSSIKSYAEQVIPVIRAQDQDGVVLVGTHGWGSLGISDGRDENDVINNQVNATNIMYTFHFYAGSHGDQYLGALSRAADRIPMFVSEWGTQTASGDGANNFVQSQKYIDLMAAKKISWTSWNFSDDFRTGAAFTPGTCGSGPYTGSGGRLKEAGQWVRSKINTPDDFPRG